LPGFSLKLFRFFFVLCRLLLWRRRSFWLCRRWALLRFCCWWLGSRLRLSFWNWSVLRRRGLCLLWTSRWLRWLCPSRSGGFRYGLCSSRRGGGSSGCRRLSCRFHGPRGCGCRGTCWFGLRMHWLSRWTGSRCGSRRDHWCDRLAFRNRFGCGNNRRTASINRGKLLAIL
jgi:hypothetical protein